MNEIEIIELFAKKLGLEELSLDDVAVVNLGGKYNSKSSDREDIVFKCDMLVQSTDVPPQMRPWQIARKSLVSCVSDMVAKGIRPYVAMISIGIPRGYPTDAIWDLADGFKIASKEFGVKIVGGDTNECKEVVIDCSMIGIA